MQEPGERPSISQVNSALNTIDPENNNLSTIPYSKGSEESNSCQIDLDVLNKLCQKFQIRFFVIIITDFFIFLHEQRVYLFT